MLTSFWKIKIYTNCNMISFTFVLNHFLIIDNKSSINCVQDIMLYYEKIGKFYVERNINNRRNNND